MSDPLTWQLVGVEAVKEGVKFLYGQATEAIKRWREHKGKDNSPNEVPTDNQLPAIFVGEVQPPVIHLNAVGQLATQLDQICDDLSGYASDRKDVTLDNPHLLEEVDALRQMLEAIYQQRLTFKGEQRPVSPVVEGSVKVEEIAGYVAGVRARAIQAGFVRGAVEAKKVLPNAEAVAVDVDTVGQ